MATWNPFQNLCVEQVLNGNDAIPNRLIRSKNTKAKKNEKKEGNYSSKIAETKEPAAVICTQVKEILQKPNYGEEGETVEFKTSFFYQDGRVKEEEQMRDVLKEVCAFLNNKGGVIYMGVDDHNGSAVSLQKDMDYLEMKSYRNKQEGKKMSYFGRDGYIRWINGCIRKKIDLVKKYDIEINSKFDQNGVLVITVPKGRMDVARYNGTAYVRRDCEAIKMTEEAQKELRLLRKNESTMPTHEKHAKELASITQQAMRCKKKVILHNYSSGSSQKVSNRRLEIFKCDPDNRYVYAYEISTGLVKQFKLCRAESIEILNEPWEFQHKHICQNRDVFNMSYSNECLYENIEIEMSLRAKTLLEEEYPDSKKYLHELTQTKWSLKTTVANVLGVGRFCMGLLDEIQIIKGERVRMYICDCLQKQFYQYCLNQNMH